LKCRSPSRASSHRVRGYHSQESAAAAAAAAAGPAAAAVATNARRAHLPLATPQRHLATCGRIGPFHELAETTD